MRGPLGSWSLEFSLGTKATEVLIAAVHLLYEEQSQNKQEDKNPSFDFLKETGISLGGTEGGENDSVDYKNYIHERIKKKL